MEATENQGIKENIVHLDVEGMTCANCALGIQKYLEKEGLEEVDVSFATNDVEFKAPQNVDLEKIKSGIQSLGYKVVDGKKARKRFEPSPLEWRFLITLPFSLLLLSAMFLPFEWLHNPWVQLALATPVYLIGLEQFGKSALRSLQSGVPNMDVLITLGSSAAYFYSLAGTLMHLGPTYQFYETAAMIITLILLGNIIEQRSVKQTTTAIDELARLQPQKAKILVKKEGKEQVEEVDAATVRPGQMVLVNTGDKIPVDGTVKEGKATVDESAITGESMPVFKKAGDAVIGGTVVLDGHLRVEASATGKDTVLAHIIELVKKARGGKPPIQRLADRISAVFVPVVVVISILTFTLGYFVFGLEISRTLLNSIAVLVIACPCAMGLATPTAVMVGIGKAARSGILIKGGETIELLHKVKNVVFDKTGTLSTGQFKVRQLHLLNDAVDRELVETVFASLEKHSSHPIARSISLAFKGKDSMIWKEIKEEKGIGVKGTDHNGITWMAGSYRILSDPNIPDQYEVYLTRNGLLVAALELEDELRPDAAKTVSWLRKHGYRTYLLSGDKERKTAAIAERLGIDEYFAEQMPAEKLEHIDKIKESGITAMVGDGINDAPALEHADVGVSLSNATEIAIRSARVILINGRLSALIGALLISKKTVITIRQNLFWAFFYNVLAIPVAAIGYLSPMIAAISMTLSDVVVVGNSIRLRLRKIT